MSGHTPGPWAYDYENDTGPNDDYFVEWYGMNGVFRAYREEDARLIAAAPDLLASLEECLPCLGWESDSLEELQREHELGNGYAELIIRARSAIARAKGEK